jgi:hypothetical protein
MTPPSFSCKLMILRDIFKIALDLTIRHSNYIICFELMGPVVARRILQQLAGLNGSEAVGLMEARTDE